MPIETQTPFIAFKPPDSRAELVIVLRLDGVIQQP
jgi:hypothetical protein